MCNSVRCEEMISRPRYCAVHSCFSHMQCLTVSVMKLCVRSVKGKCCPPESRNYMYAKTFAFPVHKLALVTMKVGHQSAYV